MSSSSNAEEMINEVENEDQLSLLASVAETGSPESRKKQKLCGLKYSMTTLLALVDKSSEAIEAMDRDELVDGMKILVDYINKQAQSEVSTASQRAIKNLRRTILKNIKVQLKWAPSVTNNGAPWSTTIICPECVFKAVFKTNETKRLFNEAEEFFNLLETSAVYGTAPYSLLYVCDRITVFYERELPMGRVKISGTYKALVFNSDKYQLK